MDPNVALDDLRAALAAVRAAHEAIDAATDVDGLAEAIDDAIEAADEMADAAEALDGWLSRGGYPPVGWKLPAPGHTDEVLARMEAMHYLIQAEELESEFHMDAAKVQSVIYAGDQLRCLVKLLRGDKRAGTAWHGR